MIDKRMTPPFYYVTWEEFKNKRCYSYWHFAYGHSAKEVKQVFVRDEQNERRRTKKPHMFHVRVTASRPDDLTLRDPGHLYY